MGIPQNQRAPGYAGKLSGNKPKPKPKERQTAVGDEKSESDYEPYKGKVYAPGRSGKKPAPTIAPSRGSPDYGLDYNVTSDQYLEDPALLGPSKRGSVQADPAAIAAQHRAMDELFGVYANGGATAQDLAREAQARASTDQYLRSQREAHEQDLAERGMGGSGAEIGMLLGDRQAAGSRMAQSDLDTQAMHEKRAMDALMGGAGLAGQMRGSSFNEGMGRAGADDEFSALNNTIVNNANKSDTDWLRQSKADLANKQYEAWQRGLDRNVGVASGLMGFDAGQNNAGWAQGSNTAASDSARATAAQGKANDTALGLSDPGGGSAFARGTSDRNSFASDQDAAAAERAVKGGGQVGSFVGDTVTGNAAGTSSASALWPKDGEDKKP